MNKALCAAVLLASLSASAARLQSRRADQADEEDSSLEGLYAGLGGGAGLSIIPGENNFGWDGEARLGYSFGRQLNLYLSAAVDGAKSKSGVSYKVEQFSIVLQYHLVVRPRAMVYVRGGVGVGLSTDFTADGSSAAGLAGVGGIGVEIRLSPEFFLSPELFYRDATLNGNTAVQVVGLQLSLVYY